MEEAKTGQEHLEVTGIPSATTPYAISHLPDRVAHEQDFASHLPAEHRDYLQRRHGTLNLEPLPSGDEADPLNWPAWKKNVGLILVAFHAYIAIFTAATIIPAYLPMSIALHVSLTRTSYLTSAQVGPILAHLNCDILPYRFTDCSARCLTALLETHFESLRPPPNLPHLDILFRHLQYRVRREPELWSYDGVSDFSSFFHLAAHWYWYRCGHGIVL